MYPWKVVGSLLLADHGLKVAREVSMQETAGCVFLMPVSFCLWCWTQAAEAAGLPSSPVRGDGAHSSSAAAAISPLDDITLLDSLSRIGHRDISRTGVVEATS